MTENNQTLTSLQHLLNYDAGKFASAEIQLKNSLPEWINKSGSLKLKDQLQKYLNTVELHVEKWEDFFKQEEIMTLSITNRIMTAFIDETNEKLAICTDAEISDACLLAAIQVMNHFKISMYGTAAAFAKALGMEKQSFVFHEAEVQEKQMDDRLSQLAEYEINLKARPPISLTE